MHRSSVWNIGNSNIFNILFKVFLLWIIHSPLAISATDESFYAGILSKEQISQLHIIDLPKDVLSFLGVKNTGAPIRIGLAGNTVILNSVVYKVETALHSHYDNNQRISEGIFEVIYQIKGHVCIQAPNEPLCVDHSARLLKDIEEEIQLKLVKKVLYPDWWKEIEEDKKLKKTMIETLDSNCEGNCGSPEVASAILHLQNYYTHFRDKIKNKSKHCQEAILGAVIDTFTRRRIRVRDVHKCNIEERAYSSESLVCSKLIFYLNMAKGIFLDLVQLVYGKNALDTTEARSICVDCVKVKIPNYLTLKNIIKVAKKNHSCRQLQAGEQKLVSSGTELSHSYPVKKEKDGAYSIPLFIEFYAGDDYDGEVPAKEVPKHYMQKAQKCLSQANAKMLNIKTGSKLQIKIASPSKTSGQACEKQKVHRVGIGYKNFRSNSKYYESNIDCPTITHEILHLLGLCDEYKDSTNGSYVNPSTGEIKSASANMGTGPYKFVSEYDCRITQDNSIMSNQHQRWDNVFKHSKNESLLYPGHFDAILYGDCDKNKDFNACFQLAYKSSKKDQACLNKKKECQARNILNADKEKVIADIEVELNYINCNFIGVAVDNALGKKEEKQLMDQVRSRCMANKSMLEEKLQVVRSWPDN